MKGTTGDANTDWLEFVNPANDKEVFIVHVGFMRSRWTCLYGQGCPGLFGKLDRHTQPDLGCCHIGVAISSRENFDKIAAQVELLTAEDVGPKGLAYIQRNGWFKKRKPNDEEDREHPDFISVNTKIRDGGCVFAKRTGDGDEKTGCAFVHMGNRLKMGDHVDVMPDACWQLPIGMQVVWDDNREVTVKNLVPWDADYWQGADDDGTHDSWMRWWCVDTPDAYVGALPLYLKMERELRVLMGDEGYERLCYLLDQRMGNYVEPMPGAVRNEGRPMLPLLVGKRTPKRTTRSADASGTETEGAAAPGEH